MINTLTLILDTILVWFKSIFAFIISNEILAIPLYISIAGFIIGLIFNLIRTFFSTKTD